MIPVRLTIQGIYSYQKEQTIDFTRLTAAGLFGIFGHVGSGKSTILEAMSFALFNKIDRLSGDRRNYNMMNLKSDRLYIDFEFIANDGKRYRIEVTGRRNRKNFSDVPTFKRGFYCLIGDIWIPMGDATAEAVTGLSYDNFHRTIIIPQGRFQEFLHLNVKERVTMLKELFGLNKYDLFDKTIILERENNEKLNNLEGQLLQIGETKPEDIAALKKQIDENQGSLDTLAGELKTTQERDKALEEMKRLAEDLEKQKVKLSELQNKEVKFSNLEKEVKEYEALYLAFHSELEQLGTLDSALKKQSDNLTSKKEEFKGLSDESSARQDDLEGLKPGYEKRDDLLRLAEEIKKLAQITSLEEAIKRTTEESRKEKDDLKDLGAAILADKESMKQHCEQLSLKKKILPDLKVLSQIKIWFRDETGLKEQVARERLAISEQMEKVNANMNEAFKLSGTLLSVNKPIDSFDLCESLVLIEEAHSKVEISLKNLLTELSELEIQKRLQQFAGELQEGMPCPLCGSKDHPHILDIQDVFEKLESTLERKNELDSQIRQFTWGEKELTSLLREISLTEKQGRLHKENLTGLLIKSEEHRQKFMWEQFNAEQENVVDEEMKRYDVLSREIGALEIRIDELNKSLAGKEVRRDTLSGSIRSSDNKISENSAQANILISQLTVVTRDDWAGRSLKEMEAKSASLKRDHQVITEKYKLLEERITELRSQTDILKGAIESAAKQVEATAKLRDQLWEKITLKLSQCGGRELAYVENVIRKELNLETAKNEIASFRADLGAVKSHLLKLNTELSGREYPVAEHNSVKEQLIRLRSQADDKNQQMGRLKVTLATLEKNLTALENLKKEQDFLHLRGENLNTLKNLFRGAAFVNFASRAYLENIVQAANTRFRKLTRQHLELVLDEDNNFMLRDHMNEGRLRSVKTLSGGQTFQASLSLALALADNVNRQVKADQNFFFLDEGFGSLDKESLEIVFETLKSLRKENRIVGVISHVEEMKQEIDAHLIVSIDDADGSMIRSNLY